MPNAAPKKKTQPITIPTKISAAERNELLVTLQERFEENMHRHKGMKWAAVEKKLKAKPTKLLSVYAMEITGGEPDVALIGKKNEIMFVDCSTQSPKRRSVCYDEKARRERKKFPPKTSAENLSKKMGIELLNEEEYRKLQELGTFDNTTSSWLATPADIRKEGGALFGDRRYNHVFVYHNGADSYYGARGFRAKVII